MKPLEKFGKVKIASLEDIALMKIAAIIGRGSKKDFIDTYFILKNGIGLSKLLKLSHKKFSHVRDVSIQALQALVYFDDAEAEPMPKMSLPIKWETVKSFFIKEITKFSQKALGINWTLVTTEGTEKKLTTDEHRLTQIIIPNSYIRSNT